MAIPGPFDYAAGVGEFEGVGKFESLRGFALGGVLARQLCATAVVFLNDAHAFSVGEWRSGTTVGHDRVLVLTLGTGVGSCFLDRGAPVTSGPDVPPEGRADLLTIDGAPLEDTVSRRPSSPAQGLGQGSTCLTSLRELRLATPTPERCLPTHSPPWAARSLRG